MTTGYRPDPQGEGVMVKMEKLTPADVEMIGKIGFALGIDADPPGKDCRCPRCMAVSTIAIAVKKLPADELEKFIKDTNNARLAVFVAKKQDAKDLDATLSETLFTQLQDLHGRVLRFVQKEMAPTAN
jgi:hypothetical protein